MCFSEDGGWGGLFIFKRCSRTSCWQLLPTSPPLVERHLHFSRFLWCKLPCSLLVLPTAGSSLRPEGLQSQLLPVLLPSSFQGFVCFSPLLSSPIWLLVCLFVFWCLLYSFTITLKGSSMKSRNKWICLINHV